MVGWDGPAGVLVGTLDDAQARALPEVGQKGTKLPKIGEIIAIALDEEYRHWHSLEMTDGIV